MGDLAARAVAASSDPEREVKPTSTPRDFGAEHYFDLTDGGNARRFAALHGNSLKFDHSRRRWLIYEDGVWRACSNGEEKRAARELVVAMYTEAAVEQDSARRKRLNEHAVKTDSLRGIENMLKLATAELPIAATGDEFDTNPDLLCGTNLTIHLRTGLTRPHDPADLITKRSPTAINPDAAVAAWTRFLLEVFAGDQTTIDFFQRAVGYSLTGHTTEHALFVPYGAGCNGKSTAIGAITDALGDHALTASFESFTRSRGDKGPRNDLARLRGARMVTASESSDGRRLDEATVKSITGGDKITARFLYGEHIEFKPEFKLWLSTNHLPRVDADDDAIWRRIRIIPFTESFEGRQDPELPAKLAAEREGILAWAIEGALRWYAEGLGTAPAVERATKTYRAAEDSVGAFLDDRTAPDAEGRIPTADLFEQYERFTSEAGERPLTRRRFTTAIQKRGLETVVTGGKRQIKGVRWL